MNAVTDNTARPAEAWAVRPDFVPAAHYTSKTFLDLEKDRLWPKVWQTACREQELPKVGSFVTYDIMDESIVIVRTSETELRAYFNVCQHRGRRLTDGCGQISQFHCRFHGWQYDLDGKVSRILDRKDWAGCPDFKDQDLSLVPVKVDTWGGWVFVNMDPDAEPLAAYLDPMPKFIDPFEIEAMRVRWHVSVKVPCNWKVGICAFNEAYHAYATHPQWMRFYGDDTTRNRTFGRHAMFYYPPNPEAPMGAPSPRLGQGTPTDFRQQVADYVEEFNVTLRAFFSERDAEATRRLLTEVAPDAGPYEVLGKLLEFQRDAAIASGAGWPSVTLEQMGEAGADWHVFPNLVFLPYLDGCLAYRSLPHPTDPDVCYFNVYALQRYAPGAEPKVEPQILHGDEDWKRFKDVSIVLQQDFDNMGDVQRGMKSRGFRGARTNPLQEATVSNFHKTLLDYVRKGPE
jgi:phenylpropionate dioxygenase-like ring-hydroxylating dioxygenase large terminal subunit